MTEKSKKSKQITRRAFVNAGIQGSTLIGLNPLIIAGSNFSEDHMLKVTHGACYHDCPDTCSWIVTTEGDKVTKFEASPNNPFTAGKLCEKMRYFPDDVTFHPDRILTPLKRTGRKGEGRFEKVSWNQALREVSVQLKKNIADHGGESILPFGYAGTEGLVQNNAMSGRLFAKLGASELGRTICGDTAYAGVTIANGSSTGIVPEDLIYSRYIILWGTNPVLSNQHILPILEQAKQAGAKIILIDPYRSATAEIADWHIQPLPGTDTALALGMMHVLFEEQLIDQEYVEKYTTRVEDLRDHVKKYSPEYVGNITGLSPSIVVTLAKEYAGNQPSLIRFLIGMEKHTNGASAFWAISMLPALTGAWKYQGGGFLHFTFELFGEALNWERLELATKISSPNRRTINMVEIGKALTETTLSPKISTLFVFNSNPAVIAPNQNLVIQGLQREDLFTVVIEHFLTDTARYADYIFPATTQLEHWDLMTSWGQCYINLNQPAIEPRGESKPNSEFFRLLAREMNFREEYFSETDLEIIKKTLNSRHPYMEGIDFENLLQNGWARLRLPDPWIPYARGNYKTKSGKCEFFSQALKDEGKSPMPEYKAIPTTDASRSLYPLKLLSIKSTRNFLNTSHANVAHLRNKEGDLKVEIHLHDAQIRKLQNGDQVRIFNQRGKVIATTLISDRIPEGVISIPQGFWSSLVEGGSSVNALTTDMLSDMGGGSALQETRVEVGKF